MVSIGRQTMLQKQKDNKPKKFYNSGNRQSLNVEDARSKEAGSSQKKISFLQSNLRANTTKTPVAKAGIPDTFESAMYKSVSPHRKDIKDRMMGALKSKQAAKGKSLMSLKDTAKPGKFESAPKITKVKTKKIKG